MYIFDADKNQGSSNNKTILTTMIIIILITITNFQETAVFTTEQIMDTI